MPWTSKEAKEHTSKADTPEKQKRWAKIANATLKEKGDDAVAIRTANAAMDSRFWDGVSFQDAPFKTFCKKINDDDDELKTCQDCDGTGVVDGHTCETCDGTGLVDPEEEGDDFESDLDDPDNDVDEEHQYGDSVYRKPWTHATCDKDWTPAQRKKAASTGVAMADGAFPIKTKADLNRAKQTVGRAVNRDAAVVHIQKRAKALGVKLARDWAAPPSSSAHDSGAVVSGFGTPVENTVRMYDTITIDDAAKVRDLENGYLAAMPRIARTGIQIYHGSECGRNDMDTVRVYRPHDSVFANDAVHSYTHLPVTMDHPSESVTSANWRKYAIGETGDEVLRDGSSVRIPMMLRDAKAIAVFRSGKNQLSVGYDCDLEWTPGVTDEGEEYDAIQHGIRANHLAVVAAARGGPTLKIGDSNHTQTFDGDKTMTMRTILVDGLEVQVMDTAATVIQRTLNNLQQQVQDAKDKLRAKDEEADERDANEAKRDTAIKTKDEAIKTKDKALEAKDGEIAALKQQLEDEKKKSSPAAIDAASRERATVVVKAQQLLGGQLKTDGMSVPELRRAVVDARIGNCKDWSDDRIGGAFDALQAGSTFGDGVPVRRGNDMQDAVAVFGRPGGGYVTPQQARDQAYREYDEERSNAWKNETKN